MRRKNLRQTNGKRLKYKRMLCAVNKKLNQCILGAKSAFLDGVKIKLLNAPVEKGLSYSQPWL